jgi:uncharacterized protein (DUF1778 family)
VAYPKKDPSKLNVNLGVSLPADIKAKLTVIAAADRKTLSRFVLDMALKELKKADKALERQSQTLKAKAQSVVKKGR